MVAFNAGKIVKKTQQIAKTGMDMFKSGRKAGKTPAMLKTKWYDPKLGNIEYLTPQGRQLKW